MGIGHQPLQQWIGLRIILTASFYTSPLVSFNRNPICPVDSLALQELARVQEMLGLGIGQQPLQQWIGLRINPQVGAGSIATHSTATMTSKFGIGLRDDTEKVLRTYQENEWLNAIHVHVGSQVCVCAWAVSCPSNRPLETDKDWLRCCCANNGRACQHLSAARMRQF